MESTQFCSNCKRDVAIPNFAIHSAFCERKIQLCEKCDEPVHRAQFEEHEREYHVMDVCSDCKLPMEKWRLSKHKDSCPKRLVICKFCDICVALDELDDHTHFCGSRTEQCDICKEFVLLKEKENHPKSCLKSQKCEEYINDYSDIDNVAIAKRRASLPVKNHVEAFMDHTSEISNQNSEVYSARSRECPICYEMIPYMDMKTHIPTCRPNSCKCFTCGKYMSADQLKDHMKLCSEIISEGTDTKPDITVGAESIDTKNDKRKVNVCSAQSGECPFCHQMIRWIDMNMHIAACSTNSGKCSGCGECIPADQLKDHVLTFCSRSLSNRIGTYQDIAKRTESIEKETDRRKFNGSEDGTKICPSCHQCIPKIQFGLHLKHCKKDLALGGDFHEAETKIQQDSLENETTFCKICKHEISRARFEVHSFQCQKQLKKCTFCNKEYSFKDDKNHIISCTKIAESIEEQKKAEKLDEARKKSEFCKQDNYNLLCPYCENLVQEDSYSGHLAKCSDLYIPVSSKSSNRFDHRSQEHHITDDWKQVGAKKKQNKNKPANPSSSGTGAFRGFLNALISSSQQERPSKSIAKEKATEEFRLPCEFCNKLFCPDFIIEHQSGCRPDLVSYSKEHVLEKSNQRAQSANDTLARSATSYRTDESKRGARRKFNRVERDNDIKPGEFLNKEYSKLSNSYTKNSEYQSPKHLNFTCRDLENSIDVETRNDKNENEKTGNSELGSHEVKDDFSSVMACWNLSADSSMDDDMKKLESFQSSSALDDVQTNVESKSDMKELNIYAQKDDVMKNYSEIVDESAMNDESENADLDILLKHCATDNYNACYLNNFKSCAAAKTCLLTQNSTSANICCTDCPCKVKKTSNSCHDGLQSEPMDFDSTDTYPVNTAPYNALMEMWQNVSEQDKALVSNELLKTSVAKSGSDSRNSKNEYSADATWKEWRKKEASDSE